MMLGVTSLEDNVLLWHCTQGVGGVDGEEKQHVANSSSYIRVCVKMDSHFFTVNVGCLKKN